MKGLLVFLAGIAVPVLALHRRAEFGGVSRNDPSLVTDNDILQPSMDDREISLSQLAAARRGAIALLRRGTGRRGPAVGGNVQPPPAQQPPPRPQPTSTSGTGPKNVPPPKFAAELHPSRPLVENPEQFLSPGPSGHPAGAGQQGGSGKRTAEVMKREIAKVVAANANALKAVAGSTGPTHLVQFNYWGNTALRRMCGVPSKQMIDVLKARQISPGGFTDKKIKLKVTETITADDQLAVMTVEVVGRPSQELLGNTELSMQVLHTMASDSLPKEEKDKIKGKLSALFDKQLGLLKDLPPGATKYLLVPVYDGIVGSKQPYVETFRGHGFFSHIVLHRHAVQTMGILNFVNSDGTPGERVSMDALQRLCQQMIAGVNVLHKMGLVHLKIAPESFLMLDSGDARLANFAGTEKAGVELPPGQGDAGPFTAPEVANAILQKKPFKTNPRADIWSLGVSMYALLTGGQLPYGIPTSDPGAHLAKLLLPCPQNQAGCSNLQNLTNPEKDLVDAGVDPQMAKAIGTMLSRTPDSRPTAEELVTKYPVLRATD